MLHRHNRNVETPATVEIVLDYVAALATGGIARMETLQAPNFVLDFVHAGGEKIRPLVGTASRQFWPVWLSSFSDMRFRTLRLDVDGDAIVVQWFFSGIHNDWLRPPAWSYAIAPSGRTIRMRGLSTYFVSDAGIERETTFVDLTADALRPLQPCHRKSDLPMWAKFASRVCASAAGSFGDPPIAPNCLSGS